MKVKCINNSGTYLIQDDIYDVEKEVDGHYYLYGLAHSYYKTRFEVVLDEDEKEVNKKEIPEVIYLQWFDDDGVRLDEEDVTWCADQINNDDFEYKLVKKVE